MHSVVLQLSVQKPLSALEVELLSGDEEAMMFEANGLPIFSERLVLT